MIPAALLLVTFFFFLKYFSFFFFLFISNECSLKDSRNLSIQSSPLYTSSLFSVLLNDDIVDIEEHDRI